jgi:hypothetical protein
MFRKHSPEFMGAAKEHPENVTLSSASPLLDPFFLNLKM